MTTMVTGGDAQEYKIPGALLAVGVGISLAYAFLLAGPQGVAVMSTYLTVRIIVQVVLGVVACFLTARIMGASFGYLTSAVVKLAAIFIFPAAVTMFIPWVGWLVALGLYWGLLEWLFDLDVLETIVLALVIWAVSALAVFLVAAIGFAAR